MNPYAATFLLLTASLIQASFLPHFMWRGLGPDLVMLLVISWSLLRGAKEGPIWGFIGGLTLDLLSASPLGLSALLLTIAGASSSRGQKSIYRINILLPLTTAFLASLGYHLALLLSWQIMGRPTAWQEAFLNTVLPTALMNTLLMLIIYPSLSWLHRRTGPERMEW